MSEYIARAVGGYQMSNEEVAMSNEEVAADRLELINKVYALNSSLSAARELIEWLANDELVAIGIQEKSKKWLEENK